MPDVRGPAPFAPAGALRPRASTRCDPHARDAVAVGGVVATCGQSGTSLPRPCADDVRHRSVLGPAALDGAS